MGGNNKKDFLAKQQVLHQGFFDEGMKIGMQKMWDMIQIILHEPETMKKDVFGRARIEKIYRRLAEVVDHYHTAFTDDVEADYVQEEMDAKLREIWGPFRVGIRQSEGD